MIKEEIVQIIFPNEEKEVEIKVEIKVVENKSLIKEGIEGKENDKISQNLLKIRENVLYPDMKGSKLVEERKGEETTKENILENKVSNLIEKEDITEFKEDFISNIVEKEHSPGVLEKEVDVEFMSKTDNVEKVAEFIFKNVHFRGFLSFSFLD